MIAVDTNVLLRLLLEDDAPQQARALRLLSGRHEASVRVSLIVVAELAWTLQCRLKADKLRLIGALEALLNRAEPNIEDRASLVTAIDWFRARRADFGDYLLAASNRNAGAGPTYSVDERTHDHPTFAPVPS